MTALIKAHANKDNFIRLIMIILGNLVYSLAIAFFIIPGGLITGGTTGIALFINYLHPFDISLFVLIFNIVMFVIGLLILGKGFALSTVLSSLLYPIFLKLGQALYSYTGMLTDDYILCALFGGVLIGSGIGLVIRAGASTGGMDIPPLVLNKKFGINVSFSLYFFDVAILLLQAIFADKEQIMYGILLVAVYSITLEKVLVRGKSKVQLEVISDKYKEINNMITSQFDRGSTLYEVEGGYTRREIYSVLTIINRRELFAIQEAVMEIDPAAFMIVSEVNEVRGRGFTLKKRYHYTDDGHFKVNESDK